MSIRRVDRGVGLGGTGASRAPHQVGGEAFARLLDSAGQVQGSQPAAVLGAVAAVGEQPNPRQGKRQLDRARELLDSLEALEQGMVTPCDVEAVQSRLRESRDQALHALSDAPRTGDERELLHRTAVLATVELAKSSRGDYQ